MLPPFAENQALSIEELIDIVVFGMPKSWKAEMDRQDFDPFRLNCLTQLVNFCERFEAAEDSGSKMAASSNAPKAHKKAKHHPKAKPNGDGKWCSYHRTATHDTSECKTLNKLKATKQRTPHPAKQPSNERWKRKAEEASRFSKSEINALALQVSAHLGSMQKQSQASNKRKVKFDDDDSNCSLNMLEKEIRDIDEHLNSLNSFSPASDNDKVDI